MIIIVLSAAAVAIYLYRFFETLKKTEEFAVSFL